MDPILDSPEVREALAPMSVEFYQSASDLGWFDEEVELLEGFPVKKVSKCPLHENLVEELLERIRACLTGARWISKERPIQCSISQPEPDIAVFAGPRDFRAMSHPTTAEFVIEVSVNTLEKDLRKGAIYAGANVGEYWVIDPKSRAIIVHRHPSLEGYREILTFGPDDRLSSSNLEGFAVQIGGLLEPG